MEEAVPLASNIAGQGSGNRSSVQQRNRPTSSAATTAPSASAASASTNNDGTNRTAPSSLSTGTTTRRRQHQSQGSNSQQATSSHASSSSSSIISSLLSPTFLISKLIIIISILLKIILYPIRKISYTIFPLGEFDGLTRDGISDKAAQVFVNMFAKNYVLPRYGHLNDATNQSRSDDDDGDNDNSLLTSCPFTNSGYLKSIEQITSQHSKHQQSISNISTSTTMFPTEAAPPLLLIYLHSPFHSSTPTFCHEKLCSNRILTYLNKSVNEEQLVCWGGSIHTADGKNVQSLMNVTSFPFMALVRVRPQSTTNSNNNSSNSSDNTTNPTRTNLEMYLRLEGHKLSTISTNTLYTYISRSIHEYHQSQNEEISRLIARQEEIHLRNEQDREYREALEEAQRLERQKEEEEHLRKEEERKKREELEKIKTEKEDRISEAKRILGLFGDEPDGKNKDDNCVRLRLMIPSGQRIERRFRGKETIDTVKSFLILHFEEKSSGGGDDGNKIENFQLSSNYPKKALVDGSATLESEGLCPQAVIMVQDLDA